MMTLSWHEQIATFDERRNIALPGDRETTLTFCLEHFIAVANQAMEANGAFYVALAGGSTPLELFKRLSSKEYRDRIKWKSVHLFWGDERSVPEDHPDNNYRAAMEAGLGSLPIPEGQIHRMVAEEEIEQNAEAYEELIRKVVPGASFDLIMLGMGDDGHTASLFPQTHALHTQTQLVVSNYVPQKSTWRMTLTYKALHKAKEIVLYVLGASKAECLDEVLNGTLDPERLPSQLVGVPQAKALWVADEEAAANL